MYYLICSKIIIVLNSIKEKLNIKKWKTLLNLTDLRIIENDHLI